MYVCNTRGNKLVTKCESHSNEDASSSHIWESAQVENSPNPIKNYTCTGSDFMTCERVVIDIRLLITYVIHILKFFTQNIELFLTEIQTIYN